MRDKSDKLAKSVPIAPMPRAGESMPQVSGPRRVMVQRNPLPQVNSMLADAYHTLARQIARFRHHGESEIFDVKQATAFNKLITSLTTLQETERRNASLLELSNLSPAELEALAQQADAILRPDGTVASSDPE